MAAVAGMSAAAVEYPGAAPVKATAAVSGSTYTVGNDVLSAVLCMLPLVCCCSGCCFGVSTATAFSCVFECAPPVLISQIER